MSLLFVYRNSSGKIIKSQIEKDLKLHEIRFIKKFNEIQIGKIRNQFKQFSAHVIPIPNSEIFLIYDSCDIKISQHGMLKINGKDKEKVLKNGDYFEKIILENQIIPAKLNLRSLIY